LESELFGHEKGAFTGAHYKRKGKFEMANGGTIFLDEIGTISPKMQIELLRVIESKQFSRVGGNEVIKSDFRVIAATNEALEDAVKSGRFREDLYYRLDVFTIHIPPLRERLKDIPVLAYHFLEKFSSAMNKKVKDISPEAMEFLLKHNWPGNVRELENAIERAVVVTKSECIEVEALPFHINSGTFGFDRDDQSLAAMEKRHIVSILKDHNWNITRTAEALGIDRVTLYNKISKYNIQRS
jgi:transcriptional regulator with PAS, ATPase and Fis domain